MEEHHILLDTYIKPLGKKPYNQFIRAIDKPLTDFATKFVLPNLVAPNGNWYLQLAPEKDVERTSGLATAIKQQCAEGTLAPPLDLLAAVQFFCATLRDVPRSDPTFHHPMNRVRAAPFQVFTFEYDQTGLDFFETQLAWLRSPSGKELDSAMGTLYRALAVYQDFLGITVNWSGNKSLHIHLVFDPRAALHAYGIGWDDSTVLRRGFADHWEVLSPIVSASLGVPAHILPDVSLRFPDTFRRFPGGTRPIEATKGEKGKEVPFHHILGIPAGTLVPQVALWERYRDQTKGDAGQSFFQHRLFAMTSATNGPHHKGIGSPARKIACGDLTAEQVAHCEMRLRQIYPDDRYPRLDRLAFTSGAWRAYFLNSAADGNAASYMREDYAAIHLCGRDIIGLNPPRLAFPLGEMMRLWIRQLKTPAAIASYKDSIYQAIAGGVLHSDPSEVAGALGKPAETLVETDAIRNRDFDADELHFQEHAVDKASTTALIGETIMGRLVDHPALFVKGPEGAGKTRGIFARHDEIMDLCLRMRDDHDDHARPTYAMYAFATYEGSAEKAREFNALRTANTHAIVMRSFGREYDEVCKEMGETPITPEQAMGLGYQRLFDVIVDQQPGVAEAMRRRHKRFWRAIGGRCPAFFTVHGVAETWNSWTQTRLYWHRDFWMTTDERSSTRRQRGQAVDASELEAKLKFGMRMDFVCYDEITPAALVDRLSEPQYDWLTRLRSHCPAWRVTKSSTPLKRYEEYAAFVRDNPTGAVGYEDAKRFGATSMKAAWQRIVIADSGETLVPDNATLNIYAASVGKNFWMRQRGWWKGLAHRVVVLTTELRPTVLAASNGLWNVLELQTPKMPRDIVLIEPSRFSAKSLAKAVTKFRAASGRNRTTQVISNKVAHLADTITHHSARGSNAFMGKDVAQTLHAIPPAEWEENEALNAYAGVTTMIGYRYVDQFNQSAGRNLGFRRTSSSCTTPRHHLLVPFKMLIMLLDIFAKHSRYDFRLRLNKDLIYHVKQNQ